MLGTAANPLNPRRMELILAEMEKAAIDIVDSEEEALTSPADDEVSVIFYGEPCDCTARSTCMTRACKCQKDGSKCSSVCHNDKNKCKNMP